MPKKHCSNHDESNSEKCRGCEGQGWTGGLGRFSHGPCDGTGKICKTCGEGVGPKQKIPN